MPKIRVTRKFSFEMAHALYEYDGLCRNIHGHTYHLEVCLIGEAKKEPGHPEDGMVMDFGKLKEIVKRQIVDVFDHTLLVNSLFPKESIEAFQNATERLVVVGFQPTTENLVIHFVNILQPTLPSNVSLFSMRLYETPNSFAEWFATDNQ